MRKKIAPFLFVLAFACRLLAATGGPDGFGYVWRDDGSGGSSFSWIEISGTGTNLSLADESISSALSLGFGVGYYGTNYTQIRVGSNGFITFNASETGTYYTNATIPAAASPNLLLAPYWDDMNPGATGAGVFYQAFTDYFVVEWNAVPRYNVAGSEKTFEVIINRSGLIKFQYKTVGNAAANPSNTIGIENSGGTVGLLGWYNGTATSGFNLGNNYPVEFLVPSNLVCSGATALACDSALTSQSTGSSNNATAYGCSAGSRDGNEVVYSVTLASTQNVDIAISNFGSRDLDVFLLSACNEKTSCVSGGGDTISVDSLAAGTYYVVVDGKTAGDNGSFDVELACNPPSPLSCGVSCQTTVMSENFDAGSPPAGWTTETIGGNAWVYTTVSYCAGSGAVRYPYHTTQAGDSWIFTPGMSLAAGNYRLSFAWKVYSASYPEKMNVWLGSANASGSMTTQLWNNASMTSTTCQTVTVDFTVPSTGTWYVGFHDYSAAYQYYLYVDTVSVCALSSTAGNCSSATTLSCPSSSAGTTAGGLSQFNGYSCSTDQWAGHETVYRIVLTESTEVQATLSISGKRDVGLFLLSSACDPCSCTVGGGRTIDRVLSAGTYYLVVDGFSSADDGGFTLDLACVDPCGAIPVLACNTTVSGDTTDNANDTTAGCITSAGRDEKWKVTFDGPVGSTLTVGMPTPTWDHVIYAISSCLSATTCLGYADSGSFNVVTTTSPQTFYVVVDGWSTSAYGAYSGLTVSCPLPNNISCATATALSCGAIASGTTAGAPDNASEYAGISGTFTGGEKIYVFTLASPQNVDIWLRNSGSRQMRLILLDTDSPTCNVNNVRTGGVTEIHIDGAAAATYYLIVDGVTASDNGTFDLELRCNPPATLSCTGAGSAESFDSVTPPALPTGWTTEVVSGNAWNTYSDVTYACSGTKFLRYPYHSTQAADSWVFTTAYALAAGTSNTLSFKWRVAGSSYPEAFSVWVGNSPSAAAMSQQIWSGTNLTATTCQSVSQSFSVGSTGNWYVGIHATSAADNFWIVVDDLGLSIPVSYDCSSAQTVSCPFTSSGATTSGGSSVFNAYSCSTDSWLGNERIYTLTLAADTRIVASLSNTGSREVGLFLLSACDPCSCLTGGGTSINRIVSAGTYRLVVDGFKSSDDGAFDLSLSCEDPCVSIPILACGVPVSGDTSNDSNLLDPTCSAGGSGPEETWKVVWNGAVGSTLTVSMPTPSWDHILWASSSCTDPSSCISWVDSGNLVLTTTTSPQTFYVFVDGYSSTAKGTYSNLLLTCPLPNNISCAAATPVACGDSTSGDTIGAANDASQYVGVNGTFTGGEKIYALTLPSTKNVDIYLTNFPGRRMYLFLLDIDSPTCNVNNLVEGGVSTISLGSLAAGTYYIVVDGRTPADNGTFDLRVVCNDPASPPVCGVAYTVTEPATYSWDDASGGTAVALADDANSGFLTIPFAFSYDGTPYTQIAACSNGWASFTDGTSTTLANASIPTATAPNALLAAFWDDLYASTLYYTTLGSAPNRRFVVEWLDFPDCCASTNPKNTFEIVLFETTNVIEYRYNQVGGDRTSCTIGIESADGLSGTERYQDNVPTVPALGSYAIRFIPGAPAGVPDCSSPTVVACDSVTASSNSGGGLSNNVTSYGCGIDTYAGNEKVFRLTLATGQVVELALSAFGSRELDLFVLSSCSACSCIAGGSDAVKVYLPAGTYTIVVDGFTAADNGPFTLTATCTSCADPGGHSRWTSCENPRDPITTSTTSAFEWLFDDCDYCRDAYNECFTDPCTFDMYVVAECGSEMHMPLYDNESGNLRIYDLQAGQYVYLYAASTGGWTAEGTTISWQDCEGIDDYWNDQTTDIRFNGNPTLCGIYRAEFKDWGGFIWNLYSNCDGTDSPGFRIYDTYCEALAAYKPRPSLSVESMVITGSCPTYTASYAISNAGCQAASTTVVVTSDLGGSTEKNETNILPGETRIGSITINVQTGGTGNIYAYADFYDSVLECQEAGSTVTACSIAGGTSSISRPVSCGCVIPQFSNVQVEDLSCPVGTRVFWSSATFQSGAGHYDVHRSTVSFADAVASAPIATNLGGAQFQDNTTNPGTTYWYVVRAEDNQAVAPPCTAGPHGGSYTDVNVGPIVDNLSQNAAKPYDVDNDLRLGKSGGGVPLLSWSTVVPDPNTTHYHVYRATNAEGGFPNGWSQIAPDKPAPGYIPSSAASWTDSTAAAGLLFYDLRSANDCEDICPMPLNVSFSSSSPSCTGTGSIAFDSSVVGGLAPFTYDWDFGDGSAHSTVANPVHVFTFPPNQRTVTLTVTDSTQPSVQVRLASSVVGSGPPVSASIGTVQAGLQVTFDGIGSGGTGAWSWSWRFGDGSTSIVENPVHTYSTAGSYVVRLTATDTADGCQASATTTVVVP
jgi:hypothetical protein